MVRFLVQSAITACASALLFSPSLTVAATQSQLSLYGINYNIRKGPDWAPFKEKCKNADEVDADFATLANITNRVRIYSVGDCNQGDLVLTAAHKHSLTVELGLWVNGDPKVFNDEKARLVQMLAATDSLVTKSLVSAIHVGSEAIYRKEVTSMQAITYMEEIRDIVTANQLGIPVTIADIGDVYLAHTDLIDAVDFVSANGFPFWENKPVDGAVSYFYERMEPLMNMTAAQNKDFVISETGWASHGSHVDASIASPANARKYLEEFYALASSKGWKYYYFEAFDEPWKLQVFGKDSVEAHFGLLNPDRSVKSTFASLAVFRGGSEETLAATSTTSDTTSSGVATTSPTQSQDHSGCVV